MSTWIEQCPTQNFYVPLDGQNVQELWLDFHIFFPSQIAKNQIEDLLGSTAFLLSNLAIVRTEYSQIYLYMMRSFFRLYWQSFLVQRSLFFDLNVEVIAVENLRIPSPRLASIFLVDSYFYY